jgi:predicted metal-dependent hydrolase
MNNRYFSDMERKVPTRRMSFEESVAAVPKHFAGDGNVVMSHLWATMSAVFPDGEDFFVRSVRHHRDQVTDPVLKRQVAGFIGQEAMHGREHRVLNDRFDEVGYPVATIAKWSKKGLELRERIAPPIANLAATVALEHVTALLAERILDDPDSRALLGDGAVRDMFLWHALEESEHKAVAFDVYRTAGGSETLRRWTMRVMRFGLVGGLLLQTGVAVLVDGKARRRARRDIRAIRSARLFSKETWELLKDFERPDFHPDDRDTTALLEEWREKLFGTDGTLNDRLVGVASA